MNHNEVLYDEIGNEYRRKNLYLLELAKLQSRLEAGEGKKEAKKKINKLKREKDKHPYNIKLNEFKKREKEFLSKLKEEKKSYNKSLDDSSSSRMKDLMTRLFLAEKKLDFYRDYTELNYDAELEYESNKLKREQIPDMIDYLEAAEKDIEEIKNEKDNRNPEDEHKRKIEINNFKEKEKRILKEEVSRIKIMRKKGQISNKAEKNEIREIRSKHKQALKLKSFDSFKKANTEKLKARRHEVNADLKQQIWVLKSDISDIKSVTPIETAETRPIIAYFTFLLPGLGQIINKQYFKGLLFLLVSLFVYIVAIPYALGYGNYQGEGISGLINLAKDGVRIDKSLIFMIEGILAVFLVIIGIALMYISFKDVYKVRKNRIKGIRANNWFETSKTIREEGFPYIVSSPALILVVFTVLVPVTTAILLSFTGMDPQHQSKFPWVGLDNYRRIALGQGLAGEVFWYILIWTVIWTLAATTLAILIGFLLAILANNDRVKGKTFFRSVFILPWAVPAFITIMFFSIMLSSTGALTEIMFNLTGRLIEVKSNPTLTRIALILLQGWLGSSYIFLLSTGVMQAIPGDLYEAADIDGATGWQKIRHITLPIVLFQTAPLLVGQYTFNFNNFSIIYLFNGGGPFNPTRYGNLAGSSDLLISYIYKLTMDNQYQAIGAAITILISFGLMLFAFVGYRNSRAFKEERL